MPHYTVIWDKQLEADYINLWTKSGSEIRETLTAIANWVDEELAVDPESKGHWRNEVEGRVLAVPVPGASVSVVYQVSQADRIVNVTRFRFRRKN